MVIRVHCVKSWCCNCKCKIAHICYVCNYHGRTTMTKSTAIAMIQRWAFWCKKENIHIYNIDEVGVTCMYISVTKQLCVSLRFFSSIVFFFDVFRSSIHVFSGILFNFIITLIGNYLSFILQSAVVRILIRCISIHIFC